MDISCYNCHDNKADGFTTSHLVCNGARVNITAFLMFLCYFAWMGVFCPRFNIFWRCFHISSNKKMPINDEITAAEVRLIGKDGSQLGIVSSDDALKLAYSEDLDLVMIAPQAVPPVCKVMDYSKYVYEQNKREKEARKNQKVVEIKEIRLSLNIDTHDFETKGGHAIKFLKDGNRVKVSIRFRGREMGHPELGLDIMNRFADYCEEFATVEKPAKLEGRNMLMFLAAKSAK